MGRTVWVGVDVGGTFTDLLSFDSSTGVLKVLKVPTTSDPSEGVMKGVRELVAAPGDVSSFSHATTIATNALLTRTGLARTAFVTNEGFRDVLELGRQRRPEVYNLRTTRPPPLVRRRDRFTVRCRVSAGGEIIEEMDRAGALEAARRVASGGYGSVAVCFLNSHANRVHESRMRGALRKAGFRGNVSLSCEVDNEYREYERSSTTAVNAALVPLMAGYLRRLERSLRSLGLGAPVYVMDSDGGMGTARHIASHPVAAIESGPAAGVLASSRLARRLSLSRVLTFDMGGTTAKAGAVVDGEPELTEEFEAAGKTHSGSSIKGSGYAVRGSFIDLAEVSAGGGTVAWVDQGGALVVGPRSAGAVPGPACYGRGGREATVTDANLFLGRLNQRGLVGGGMRLHADLASESLAALGRGLRMSAREVAVGVVRLVNNAMAKAVSIMSVERGRDPREFTMMAFGGSGPVHACDLADDLGVRDVIVPVHAGLFSAYGLMVAGVSRTFVGPAPGPLSTVAGSFSDLERSAAKEMKKEGITEFSVRREVEARYLGQSHELLLPFSGVQRLRRAFDSRHKALYGYSSDDPVQVVSVRIRASLPGAEVPWSQAPARAAEPRAERRPAWIAGGITEVPVLSRERLSPGKKGTGPCIIEEYDSTLVVNPGWKWKTEEYGMRLRR